MPDKVLEKDKAIMLSRSSQFTDTQISLVECLVPSNKEIAWIQIANFIQTAVRLHKWTPISEVQIIDNNDIQNLPIKAEPQITHIQQGSDKNKTSSSDAANTKSQDFSFDLSDSDLTEQQKQELQSLLHEYRECFANSMEETGCTHLISHSIDTMEDIPIRAHRYKTSPEMMKKS